MDILTHIFLPLTFIYLLKRDFRAWHIGLALLAILPDFDVLTGIHRGLFHSILFLGPLTAGILALEYKLRGRLKHSLIAVAFLFSHILLDFISGGVPFLYPLVNVGVGLEFPLILRFGESVSLVDISPKIVYNTPQQVYGEVNAFSEYGVASATLFITIYWRSRKERANVPRKAR